jgi:phospholipid/cholesterol/gamma-HCH transport system permease protein
VSTAPDTPASATLTVEPGPCLSLAGRWALSYPRPDADALAAQIEAAGLRRLGFDTSGLQAWDSTLIVFLRRLRDETRRRGVELDPSGLPDGARQLLALADAVPPADRRAADDAPPRLLASIGTATLTALRGTPQTLAFIGEATRALGRLIVGRARMRGSDLLWLIQECGPRALPIVTLISFLVGMILAYMGAVQLQDFGAQIYVADLVGLGMAREMGAIMTGVIMAGRSGAAFAAQLGTMQVNEEIDALRTLGVSPMEFLVLPRMLALVLMVPLLTLYADFVGILAGLFVGVTLLDLGAVQYLNQTVNALELRHFVAGLIKAAVFGVLIAVAGCMRGMQCGRSAQAVGEATTSAVVTAIVYMVVAAALLTILFERIGL